MKLLDRRGKSIGRYLRMGGIGLVLIIGATVPATALAATGGGLNGNPGTRTGVLPAQAQAGESPGHRLTGGEQAIVVLGERLPSVARAYGLEASALKTMFRSDDTLAVDENDELLYVDHLAPGEVVSVNSAPEETTALAPPTDHEVFTRASRPGADHTVYLDFDGHVTTGTSWVGDTDPIDSPAYDIDGLAETWSATELSRIQATWEAVAEDFAPFDLNVTTIEPSVDDLKFTGSGDTRWGTRVVFTVDNAMSCGCGGIAYIGSFDDFVDEPVFVYNASLTGIIEAASHEVGHAMLLAHDGQASGSSYYSGHGSADTSWGPIMGASYSRRVTQWSAGAYYDANNVGSNANYGYGASDLDVLSSLTNGNGFGYRPDDHGDDSASATSVSSGTHDGIISTTTDVDTFAVMTGGGLSVAVSAHPSNPNLDVRLSILDGLGSEVAVSDESGSLSASLDLPGLPAGAYTIEIDGTGWGSPLTSPPSGWTEYGSLGKYTMVIDAPTGPPDTQPPAAPAGLSVDEVTENAVIISWSPSPETDLASYQVKRGENAGGQYTILADVPAGTASFVDSAVLGGSTYYYVVSAADVWGNVSPISVEVVATTPPSAIAPDVVSGEIPVAGSVNGTWQATTAADGIVQTITESHSGGPRRTRYDLAEHIWQLPVTAGNHLLSIDAAVTDGGDGDDGFDLSWSSSSSGEWEYLATLRANVGSGTFDLGSPTGTVFVRVSDTNSSATNTGYDSIAVDHVSLGGGTPPSQPPESVSNPLPGTGAAGVSLTPTLSWSPGLDASSYVVTVIADGATILTESVMGTSLRLDDLSASTTHTWRVDAVNVLGTTTGPSWTFTTVEPATMMSVQSLDVTTVSAGRRQHKARATASVVDSNGEAVFGATLVIRFGGDIVEDVTTSTDSAGIAVATTTGAAKSPTVTACVASLSGAGLTHTPSLLDC